MKKTATLWLTLLLCLAELALAQTPPKDAETLARQVIAALETKDERALKALSIDRAEFTKYIWPTLVARVGGQGVSADKFFVNYSNTSDFGLKQHLTDLGGKKFEFVKWDSGPEDTHKGYRLVPNPEIVLKNQSGQEQTLRLGSALLEHDGIVKVASYFRSPAAGK